MGHMKITGLLFWVQENHLSAKFYKKLGFDVIHEDDEHSAVALHDLTITLVSMRDEDQFTLDAMAAEKGRGMYVYIRVTDVDETYRKLRAAGCQPVSEPRDWKWGNREFIVKDPDGYKLCFWHPLQP